MKIYTKTGDDGSTGLQGNVRIGKSHLRIVAYGMVDEANASLGVAISNIPDSDISQVLTGIQNDLFLLGADLSNPNIDDPKNRVSDKMVQDLESLIDRYESELPDLTNFILPGGAPAAALIHHARTITRRAEIAIVALSKDNKVNSNCIKYMNRLSDLLFVLARMINKQSNKEDIQWKI